MLQLLLDILDIYKLSLNCRKIIALKIACKIVEFFTENYPSDAKNTKKVIGPAFRLNSCVIKDHAQALCFALLCFAHESCQLLGH